MSESSESAQTPAQEPVAKPQPGLSFFRPHNQDPKMAFYAPERDVALQALRILGEVELLLRGDRYQEYAPMLQALRTVWPAEGTDREVLDRAGHACLAYVADCWGLTYVPGTGREQWPQAPQQLGPAEAIAKLVETAPRAGLMTLLAISGYFLMDFFYMGINQMRQTGLGLDRSANQVYSMFDMLCRSYWGQQSAESQLLMELRRAMDAAIRLGVSSGSLHAIVDKAVADGASSQV